MTPTPENNSSTEPGREHLRRAIGQLPAHEPDPATWPRIAAQLAADAALPRLVAQLPAHEPADELWAGIAARLDAAAPAPAALRTRRERPAPAWRLAGAGRRVLALAASLLLLVLAGAGWWQLRRPAAPIARVAAPAAGPRETLTVTEEVVEAPAAPALAALPPDALESQGLAFIRKGCARQPGVCSSPEFQDLHAQLGELQAQQRELQQAARRFGSSPELAREQTRLVNLQASVERQLINLLIS